MAITYPFKYRNHILYKGDIGPGEKDHFSLVLLLEDSVTGEKPFGGIIVKFKETDKKPFKNLSGAFCFKGLADGKYSLEIESDHYMPVSEEIIIESDENGATVNGIKIVPILLTPKLSYPFSGVVTMFVRIENGNNQPVEKANISGSFLQPACFFRSHFESFLSNHQGAKEILENYTETIDTKVCIYPERISPEDKQQLGNAYNEIVELSRQKLRGLVIFSYSDYAAFLKKNLMDEDFLTRNEADNGHSVCFKPDDIDDADKQKMPEKALSLLKEMANNSVKGTACFTHKKYIAFLEKYFLLENALVKYAEDKYGKVQFDLDEISQDDLASVKKLASTTEKKIVDDLKEAAEAQGLTDENGECVLAFRGLKRRSEKIAVRIIGEKEEEPEIVELVEGSTNYLKLTYQ